MAKYIALNGVVLGTSGEIRPGSIVDDARSDWAQLIAAGLEVSQIGAGALDQATADKASFWIREKGAASEVQNQILFPQSDSVGGQGVLTVNLFSSLSLFDFTGYKAGQLVYVSELKAWFMYSPVYAGAYVDTEIVQVATAKGGGALFRMVSMDSGEWARQFTWYVNATTGLDTNDGGTTTTPIKTIRELNRRITKVWGDDYTINLQTNIPNTDPVGTTAVSMLKYTVDNNRQSRFYFVGTRTVVRSGTFTTTNPANPVPASNTPALLTDTSVASWASDVGRKIFATSGSAIGRSAWVHTNVGGGVARTGSWWNSTSNPSTSPSSSPQTPPVIGDTYDVVTFTTIAAWYSNLDIQTLFVDLDVQITNSAYGDGLMARSVEFVGCRINILVGGNTANITCRNCYHQINSSQGVLTGVSASITLIGGSLVRESGTSSVQLSANSSLALSYCIFQNAGINTRHGTILLNADNGFFDCSSGSGLELLNNAFCLGVAGALYGSGQSFGARLRSGARYIKQSAASVPTITGTSGEFTVNDSSTTGVIPKLTPPTVPALTAVSLWADVSNATWGGAVTDQDGTAIVFGV